MISWLVVFRLKFKARLYPRWGDLFELGSAGNWKSIYMKGWWKTQGIWWVGLKHFWAASLRFQWIVQASTPPLLLSVYDSQLVAHPSTHNTKALSFVSFSLWKKKQVEFSYKSNYCNYIIDERKKALLWKKQTLEKQVLLASYASAV